MRTLLLLPVLLIAAVANSGCTAFCWKALKHKRDWFGQAHAAWLVPAAAPDAEAPDLVVVFRFRNGWKDPHVVRYRAVTGSYAIDDFERGEGFEPPADATELAVRAVADGGPAPFLEASPEQVAAVVWPEGPAPPGTPPGTPRRVGVVAGTGRAPAWARVGRFVALPFTLAIDVALSPVYAVGLTAFGAWWVGREISRL